MMAWMRMAAVSLLITLSGGFARADEAANTATSDEPAALDSRTMRIQVVQSDGSPVAHAGITVRAMTLTPYGPVRYRTNAVGIALINVPEYEELDLQLLIWAERHVTVGAHWRGTAARKTIPFEFRVEMEPGTSFGGIVRNEQGQPIPGAKVTVNGRKQAEDEVLWYSINDTSTTDDKGEWRCHRIPADLTGFEVNIKVQHADYATIPAVDYKSMPLDELRGHRAALVMHTGLAMEGTVTDPQGRPVAAAMVGQYTDNDLVGPRTTTDEKGRYRLPQCDPGEYVLAVVADGFAPNSRRVTLTADSRNFDLQLQTGVPIRLRIVDQDGKPVGGAAIFTVLDRETLYLDNSYRALPGNDRNLTADAAGRWSRLWISQDALELVIRKDGYEEVRKTVEPDEQEQDVTLEKEDSS